MARKFIINKNNLVLGDVHYHRDLSDNHATTKGGGGWYIIPKTNILLLYSFSAEFGKVEMSEVISAISGYTIPFYNWGKVEELTNQDQLIIAFSDEVLLQRALANYKIIKKQ